MLKRGEDGAPGLHMATCGHDQLASEHLAQLRKGQNNLVKTWWPWGAGMFATSLGPHDACFVAGANENKNSGYMVKLGIDSQSYGWIAILWYSP